MDVKHLSKGPGNGSFQSSPPSTIASIDGLQVTGDIVLGPPKTAFASSSALKTPNKLYESPSRSAFGSFGDSSRGDYFTSKGRHSGDREVKEERTRDSRVGAARNGREEGDSWSSIRSNKTFGIDEDRSGRKIVDRDTSQDAVENRDGRRQHHKHRERGEGRQNGNSREHKPSWYKEDNGQEIPSRNTHGDAGRTKDFGEGDRGSRYRLGRDKNRSSRSEQDPEWMVEPKREEKERHTAHDIEQWKASMKAQAVAATAARAIDGNGDSAQAESEEPILKPRTDAPLNLDQGMDKFFSFWDQPKKQPGESVEDPSSNSKLESGRLAAPKSSRFTGFFSPQTSQAPPEPLHSASSGLLAQQTPQLPSDSSNDDRAGFQRMLQMLRAPQASNQTMSPFAGSDSRRQRGNTPPPEQGQQDLPQAPPILSPRSRKSHGLENLLNLQSPRDGQMPPNKDSEFLLNLMRNDTDIKLSYPGNQTGPAASGPGVLPHPALMAQQQMQHRSPAEHSQAPFAEEPPADHSRLHDKLNPTITHPRQRHTPNFDNEEEAAGLPHFSTGLPPPPGLQRPMPGPGSHFIQQQQGRMVAPPPGFSSNTSQFGPALGQMANLNLGNDRGPPFPPQGLGPGGPGHGGQFMGPPPPMFPPQGANFPMMGGGNGPFGNMLGGRPAFEAPGDFGGGTHGVMNNGAPPGQYRRTE